MLNKDLQFLRAGWKPDALTQEFTYSLFEGLFMFMAADLYYLLFLILICLNPYSLISWALSVSPRQNQAISANLRWEEADIFPTSRRRTFICQILFWYYFKNKRQEKLIDVMNISLVGNISLLLFTCMKFLGFFNSLKKWQRFCFWQKKKQQSW